VAMTERATNVFNSTNPVAHALLVRIAPALLSRSAVQDRAAPRLGQIAASYRGRPIARGGGGVGRLRAGDRVPDVHLPEGRLYDLLDPSRLTLFVTGEAGHAMAAVRECAGEWVPAIAVRHVAPSSEFARHPAWLLVRPDGYLAAAGSADEGDRLNCWLAKWLVVRRRYTNASSASLVSESARPSSSSINAHSAVAATHNLAEGRG
jgi:hypothetical protein